MKLGLSTWSFLHEDVASSVRAIADAGFDGVELWGEVPHAYPDWADKKRLKDVLSSYRVLVTTHAPFTDLNPASPFQPGKGAVERTLEDFVKFSAQLGASMVTVHPGSVHNEGLVPQSTHNSVETLKKMVKAADGGLTINVENQTKSRSKYHFPLASTTESLALILAEVDGLRFTLDTGHAHVNGQSPVSIAERFKDALAEVHLSDNSGTSDDHLFPGEGTAQIDPVLELVQGRDIFLCLEIDPHRYSRDQVFRGVEGVRDALKSRKAPGESSFRPVQNP